MSIHIRSKPAVSLKSDSESRLVERQSTDFEATMWTGMSLAKTVEQRFPVQPKMPGPQQPPNREDLDPNQIMQRQFNVLNNEMWLRALRHSNQVAIAKYIANMHKNEQLSEEQAYRHVENMHDLDKAVREEITRHSVLRRISITRAAAFFAKLNVNTQRDYIAEFQAQRLAVQHERDRLVKWDLHVQKTANGNANKARMTAESDATFLALTIEAARLVAKNQAASKYEAIAKLTVQVGNEEFQNKLRDAKDLGVLINSKKKSA